MFVYVQLDTNDLQKFLLNILGVNISLGILLWALCKPGEWGERHSFDAEVDTFLPFLNMFILPVLKKKGGKKGQDCGICIIA